MRSRGHRVRVSDNFASFLSTHSDFTSASVVFSGTDESLAQWFKEGIKPYNLSLQWKFYPHIEDGKGELWFVLSRDEFYDLMAKDGGLIGEAITWMMALGKWNAEDRVWYATPFQYEKLECDLLCMLFDKEVGDRCD